MHEQIFAGKRKRACLPPCPAAAQADGGALAAYNAEIAALRNEGLTRTLTIAGAEQLFTLGFALEQMHQNLADLERCVQEWARPSRLDRGAGPSLAQR